MIDQSLSADGAFTTDDKGDVVPDYPIAGINSPSLYGRPANPHKIRAGKTPVQDLVLQHPEGPVTTPETGSITDTTSKPLTSGQQNAHEIDYLRGQAERVYPSVSEVVGTDMNAALTGVQGLKDVLEQTRRNAGNN